MVEIPRAVCDATCLSARKTRHGALIFRGKPKSLRFRIPASVMRSASARNSNQSHCRDLIIADAADMPYRAAWFRTEAGIARHVVVLAAFA
ncbi:hypothetical protein [Mesorhizobium sp. 113-3-3]|uniref:hypothetical protein n=1 Tax=Mesorhizobium sp. 113-3-3 TaxID=2744516 RepID=UPI001926EF49|nr:hypothetical protein [Mesorhizobium sp. 113-3-3]